MNKTIKQKIAAAQDELNKLVTRQKEMTRKEKTHRKIVLGGEVAKHMGLDIDHDILVGFLMSYGRATKEDIEHYKSIGSRSRELDVIRKEQKTKRPGKNEKEVGKFTGQASEEKRNEEGMNLSYKNRFSSKMNNALNKDGN